jgi:AcrR family transcriptional regulator
MREAAHAAFLSIGGLYHYFPTKRDLVLHGRDLEARDRICAEESARIGDLLQQRPESQIDITVDALMRIFAFIRPSALAVLDLGSDTLQDALDGGWTSNLGSLVDVFRRLLPDASDEHLMSLARSIRWIVRGALIDRDVDSEQVRSDLRLLIAAQVEGTSRQVA